MAEREFPGFTLRSSATKDGSRFKALLSSHPAVRGFPSYFTVYDNRSFRDEASALVAAEKALGLVLGVEEDGAPIFAEGETGFDDDLPGDETTETDDDDTDDQDLDEGPDDGDHHDVRS
ncbi:hypothetical protein C8J98_108195 [Luteibacter sp. OK325]|uniref:hypothetical protein n=1 Tax=Luteibacter sp. OK325 TaxID=2135670 RepID=UPI000D4A5985|nr:hypothetical protein [Luteibacter sp. OK325]PTR28613.1 hypothetical protein C8J98_108195 [Luteibacter sp. OK325]